MFCAVYWDPRPEIFRLPFVDWPILWYGVFFAVGFLLGFPLLVRLLEGEGLERKEAAALADRLTLYVVAGTVLGARLGHLLFYERPERYWSDPLVFLRIWEGGLASHGGVAGILLALFLFRRKIRSAFPSFSVLKLLDLLSIPAALAGGFIRIGNFFNQEVFGKPSTLPWAVVFGHPFDGSPPVPRHPAQLYEACFYFSLFALLWAFRNLSFGFISLKTTRAFREVSHLLPREYNRSDIPFGKRCETSSKISRGSEENKPKTQVRKARFFKETGVRFGVLMAALFGFRLWVERYKPEQSAFLQDAPWALNMGQLLSIPLIALGLFFLFRPFWGRLWFQAKNRNGPS